MSLKYTLKRPCENCPFRRSAPRGVWAEPHYEMLLRLCSTKTSPENMNVFACHCNRDKGGTHACAGWLIWQREHRFPACGLRLAMGFSVVTVEEIDAIEDGDDVFDDVLELVELNREAIDFLKLGVNACPNSVKPLTGKFEGKLKATCPSCEQVVPIGNGIWSAHLFEPPTP